MNAAAVAVIAMLLVSAVPTASGAAGEHTVPYIEIKHPQDGSTVGTEDVLVVVAEGKDLHSPSFSIEGEHKAFGGPLQGCIFEVPASPEGEEVTEQTMKMYCKQKLNLDSFEGEKVKISVSVKEETGTLTDSVGVYVSGHCA